MQDLSPQDQSKIEQQRRDFEASDFKWGYINKKGQLAIKAKFDECKNFVEGRALVRLKDSWGYLDTTGDLVIPAQYQEAYDFSNGFAAVKAYGEKYKFI